MSEESLENVRRGYEAMTRGDVDAVLENLHPEIEWQLPEGGISRGTLRGHQAVREFLDGYIEAFSPLRFEPERIFEVGDRVVAYVRVIGTGRNSGLEVSLWSAYVWTVENGKSVRVQVFPEGQKAAALKAAGLSEEPRE